MYEKTVNKVVINKCISINTLTINKRISIITLTINKRISISIDEPISIAEPIFISINIRTISISIDEPISISINIRTISIHFRIFWPDEFDPTLWPFALDYAVWIWIHLPSSERANFCPEEVFSRVQKGCAKLRQCRVFGCPAYSVFQVFFKTMVGKNDGAEEQRAEKWIANGVQ